MNLPASELIAALALFVGAPVACVAVCLWALRDPERQAALASAPARTPSGGAAVSTLAAAPGRRLRAPRLARARTVLRRVRPRVDLRSWREQRAATRAKQEFLDCFDAQERAWLNRAFSSALHEARRSADVQLQQTLLRLRDASVALTIVSPPHGDRDSVLLVFADATALVATPEQRDAARLLAAELWIGPVVLDGFTIWEGRWNLRFLTPSAIMPLPLRQLLPG